MIVNNSQRPRNCGIVLRPEAMQPLAAAHIDQLDQVVRVLHIAARYKTGEAFDAKTKLLEARDVFPVDQFHMRRFHTKKIISNYLLVNIVLELFYGLPQDRLIN
jgi:hypothetical protein